MRDSFQVKDGGGITWAPWAFMTKRLSQNYILVNASANLETVASSPWFSSSDTPEEC